MPSKKGDAINSCNRNKTKNVSNPKNARDNIAQIYPGFIRANTVLAKNHILIRTQYITIPILYSRPSGGLAKSPTSSEETGEEIIVGALSPGTYLTS